MTNLNVFTGFDVSKKFFDFCFTNEDGCTTSHRLDYTNEGLKKLLALIPRGCHCIMEATGPYYLRLAYWLFDHGFIVSVVNPLIIRRFCQMKLLRTKTDKADARMIALYGKTEKPECWEPPKDYLVKLQQLNAMTELLTKNRTALSNQLQAFEATGIIDPFSKSTLKNCIATIDKKLLEIEKKVVQIIESHHKHMLESLISIPGIGKKSAAVLIVVSGAFSKFTNYKQLSSYLGLSPRIYESGSSIKGRSRICKLGMSRIRAILYVCAWSAKKCNRACKELYDRLVAKGKSGRLALIAVANKLIKQAFAIATKGTKYITPA